MHSPNTISLIGELEETLKQGSSERRVEILRKVTSLFLDESERLSESQIRVFDDVLAHLIERIETTARAQLAETLAPIDRAPHDAVRRLAHDDAIAVAGPILTHSNSLTANDLLELARTGRQPHLLAISGRRSLDEALTDVLVTRGNHEVARSLAGNAGARFSSAGYSKLVERAEQDESLAQKLGSRLDIPIRLLRELLARATTTVREHLMRIAPPAALQKIQLVLAEIAKGIVDEESQLSNLELAFERVRLINKDGMLTDATIHGFARDHRIDEVIASLAIRANAPVDLIEKLMRNPNPESLSIACKAAHLDLPAAREVLANRFGHHRMAADELREVSDAYQKLSVTSAQRTLRFMQVHEAAKKHG